MTDLKLQLEVRNGKGNTTEIETTETTALFHYDTLVGLRAGRVTYIQRDGLAGSTTTGKRLNIWLGHPWQKAVQLDDEAALKAKWHSFA